MNDFHDIIQIPDFNRTIWLVKKDRKGKNDWWTLQDNTYTSGQFFKLCDRKKFFAWSYSPWGATR